MSRLVLIGPVWPYKGGISHYTGMLYRALAKSHKVRLISYKMQYPKVLHHSEQKDYSGDHFRVDEAEFLINTADLFSCRKVGRDIAAYKPDAVIIQWWHPYFTPCYRALERAIGDASKIVFICHNVLPHERFPLDRQLTKSVLAHGDGFIVHSKSDFADLDSVRHEGSMAAINPLPTYGSFRSRNLTKVQARQELNIDGINEQAHVLLFFGFIREYKGLRYLIEAMPQICQEIEKAHLLIVGAFGTSYAEYSELISSTGVPSHIHVVDGYVPDEEMEVYYEASDLVVCPYISATQSAIVQTAFGLERPVVVTNVGGLPEVVDDHETGYVVEPRNPSAIAEACAEYFSSDENPALFKRNIQASSERFSWGCLVRSIENVAGLAPEES